MKFVMASIKFGQSGDKFFQIKKDES